ncbi:MAG: hypothetical protein ACKVOE_05745 [Rickettsiales bacterium]
MQEKQQPSDKTTPVISPLAKDTTYGERVHKAVFEFGLNFMANLTLSALFSYWVNHSLKPVKLPFMKEAMRPAAIQQQVEGAIGKVIGATNAEATPFRSKAANSMASVATLTAIGHVIMIPSVWIGGIVKAPMVEWLNRRHYGDAAMEDPSLKARHLAIREEARPTLFGSVFGRFGTIAATQTTAYLVGHNLNLVTLAGRKMGVGALERFKGLDALTESIGARVGGSLADSLPGQSARLNKFLQRRDYGWSFNQLAEHPKLSKLPYGERLPSVDGKSMQFGGGFFEHYGRYVSADILYTIVTALSIGPAINFFKKFVPGITYTPVVKGEVSPELKNAADSLKIPPNKLTRLDSTENVETQLSKPSVVADSSPTVRVGTREHHDRISAHAHAAEVGA